MVVNIEVKEAGMYIAKNEEMLGRVVTRRMIRQPGGLPNVVIPQEIDQQHQREGGTMKGTELEALSPLDITVSSHNAFDMLFDISTKGPSLFTPSSHQKSVVRLLVQLIPDIMDNLIEMFDALELKELIADLMS